MKFGDRLRLLRKERSLTQSELAKNFSLGESTISFYESNKRAPDYGLLDKTADFFDVSVDYLLGRTDIKKLEQNSDAKENNNSTPFLKQLEGLSGESKEELEKYMQLLKIKDQVEKSKDETSSALERDA